MQLRFFILLFISLSLMGPNLAAKPFALTKPKLRVGLVVPLTGAMAPYGEAVKKGAEAFMKSLESENPELSEQMTLIPIDATPFISNPEEVVTPINRERVHLVIGGLTTSQANPLARALERIQKPFISLAATKETFATCTMVGTLAQSISQFALENLNASRVTLLYEAQNSYSLTLKNQFTQAFENQGGQLITSSPYPQNPITSPPIAPESQAVVILGYFKDAKTMIHRLRSSGVDLPIIGPDSWDTEGARLHKGADVKNGVYYITHFHMNDPDPEVKRFKGAFQALSSDKATVFSAWGYDGLRLSARALSALKSNRSEVWLKKLQTMPCSTFLASKNRNQGVAIALDQNGDRFYKRIGL